jgi:HSP20 family protein
MTNIVKRHITEPTPSFPSLSSLFNFKNDVESLFGHSLRNFFANKNINDLSLNQLIVNPRTDISETEKGYELDLEIPGVKEDKIDVAVTNNILTINASKESKKEEKNKQFHQIECSYGSYQRSFYLSDNIDSDNIEASYKDGVLHIVVPKSAGSSEKKKIKLKK